MSQQQIVFYTVINPLPGNNSFSNKPRYCHKTIISPIYCPKGPFIFPKKSFVFPISALSPSFSKFPSALCPLPLGRH